MKREITEEMGLHEQWYEDARKQTPTSYIAFNRHLMNDFEHDYGTICHAIAACGLSTMWAMNSHPNGGITGFQAGCIMWQFIVEWQSMRDEPLRLVTYKDMLYPQYEDKFQKTISKSTWDYLQKTAAENLAKDNSGSTNVRSHWQSIVDGHVPFGYVVSEND